MKRWLVLSLLLLMTNPVWAMSIKGVAVPDHVVANGNYLVLNGAGIRTKFFFDIYIGALYLPVKARNAKQIIASTLTKRVSMYFLQGGVGHAMLAAGWTSAFEHELPRNAMLRLKKRLKVFNAMFGDIHEGDRYIFDFLSNGFTIITLNDKRKGRIEGIDFQRALLSVWLGQAPDDPDLKQAMLNGAA